MRHAGRRLSAVRALSLVGHLHVAPAVAFAPLRQTMGEHGRSKVIGEFDVRREAAWLKQLMAGEGGDRLRPDDGQHADAAPTDAASQPHGVRA